MGRSRVAVQDAVLGRHPRLARVLQVFVGRRMPALEEEVGPPLCRRWPAEPGREARPVRGDGRDDAGQGGYGGCDVHVEHWGSADRMFAKRGSCTMTETRTAIPCRGIPWLPQEAVLAPQSAVVAAEADDHLLIGAEFPQVVHTTQWFVHRHQRLVHRLPNSIIVQVDRTTLRHRRGTSQPCGVCPICPLRSNSAGATAADRGRNSGERVAGPLMTGYSTAMHMGSRRRRSAAPCLDRIGDEPAHSAASSSVLYC